MTQPSWVNTLVGALLVLATAFAATGLGSICRRLRPAWLAIGSALLLGGLGGSTLGFGVVRLGFPEEAARDFPSVYRFILAVSALIFGVVGASQAGLAARPGGQAGPRADA